MMYDIFVNCNWVAVVQCIFISYHLFTFRGSTQDYKLHMDIEIVKFA